MKKLCFMLLLLVTGCVDIHTLTKFPDGRIVEGHINGFMVTDTVSGFRDDMTKDGRTISLDKAASDVNVEALKQSNDLLAKLMQALMAGAIQGAK